MTPLFARQPIFDRNKKVIAYELLFRQSNRSHAQVLDGDMATVEVLVKVFGENQIPNIIGDNKAFVNYTRNLICNPPPLKSKQLVIEVLEDIEPDEEVLAGLSNLKKKGFQIALDDYVLNKKTLAFLPYADFIKVDVLSLSAAELVRMTQKLRPLKIKLLAEKVEDHEMMRHCLELGFDYFQGYFLCKPEIIEGVKVKEGKQALMKLISVINDPAVEYDSIITTIASDPSLSYKILQLVNSSAIGLPRAIESLPQAITLLGITNIRNWSNFFLMANNSDKPSELCVISMTRAKMCERIGGHKGGKHVGEACFTAGLFSNLDAFLDISMEQILAKLLLSEDLAAALLDRSGELGQVLSLVQAYERGNWSDINWKFVTQCNLEAEQLNAFYLESVAWATAVVNS